MLEVDVQVKRLILLTSCSALIYLFRGKKQTLYRVIIASILIVESAILFNVFNNRLVGANPDLNVFRDLGLPRGYSSVQFRTAKRELFEKYHPDRGTSNLDKEVKLQAFQKIENSLSFMADNRKRELLDKFNVKNLDPKLDAE